MFVGLCLGFRNHTVDDINPALPIIRNIAYFPELRVLINSNLGQKRSREEKRLRVRGLPCGVRKMGPSDRPASKEPPTPEYVLDFPQAGRHLSSDTFNSRNPKPYYARSCFP